MKKSCKACKWWEFQDVYQLYDRGKCHRYPPKITLCEVDVAQPTTSNDYWCGEFEAKA